MYQATLRATRHQSTYSRPHRRPRELRPKHSKHLATAEPATRPSHSAARRSSHTLSSARVRTFWTPSGPTGSRSSSYRGTSGSSTDPRSKATRRSLREIKYLPTRRPRVLSLSRPFSHRLRTRIGCWSWTCTRRDKAWSRTSG